MKSYNLPKYFCYGTIEFLHDNVFMHKIKNMYIFYEKDMFNIVFYNKDLNLANMLKDEFSFYKKKNIDIQTALYVEGRLLGFYDRTTLENILYDDMWGSINYEFKITNYQTTSAPDLLQQQQDQQEQPPPLHHHHLLHRQKDLGSQLS